MPPSVRDRWLTVLRVTECASGMQRRLAGAPVTAPTLREWQRADGAARTSLPTAEFSSPIGSHFCRPRAAVQVNKWGKGPGGVPKEGASPPAGFELQPHGRAVN